MENLGRGFKLTEWQERDGSIKECSLFVYETDRRTGERRRRDLIHRLSKYEIEYLIWILADARKEMKYKEDEVPFLDEDLLIKAET